HAGTSHVRYAGRSGRERLSLPRFRVVLQTPFLESIGRATCIPVTVPVGIDVGETPCGPRIAFAFQRGERALVNRNRVAALFLIAVAPGQAILFSRLATIPDQHVQAAGNVDTENVSMVTSASRYEMSRKV